MRERRDIGLAVFGIYVSPVAADMAMEQGQRLYANVRHGFKRCWRGDNAADWKEWLL